MLLYIHCNIIIIVVFVVIDTTSNHYATAIAMIICFLSTIMSTTIVTLYSRCPMNHCYLRVEECHPCLLTRETMSEGKDFLFTTLPDFFLASLFLSEVELLQFFAGSGISWL